MITLAYLNQWTLAYKTFIKRAASEALQAAFLNHPDPTVAGAKVAIDYTGDDFELPAVIVKFNEESMLNAGVGHYEWLPDPLDGIPGVGDCVLKQYQHRLYTGTIEFDIYGMSSADRDILADALIEVLTMPWVSTSGQAFNERFYLNMLNYPYGAWHYAVVAYDSVQPMGESIKIAPWNPEDELTYNTGYRVPVAGEFYSYTPPLPNAPGPIEQVNVYPWPVGDLRDNVSIDPLNPPPPVPTGDYYDFNGLPVLKEVPDGEPDA